jgi:hypothetical protein
MGTRDFRVGHQFVKTVLGNCSDIPRNLAESTPASTARALTLSFDH